MMRRKEAVVSVAVWGMACGCAALQSPMPAGYGIKSVPVIPILEPAGPANPLPASPKPRETVVDAAAQPLSLEEVLASLEQNFPLIDAAEQERSIAAGLRLSAEGQFDLGFRARGANREGTFPNNTLDIGFDQPTPFHGITTFAGYRFGYGDFPVYQGGLKTAQGGEFRAGFQIPLLKDGPIDRRRAILRQAQINELLADPAVRRVRIDAYRAARRAYYNWLAAGELYEIADRFTTIAKNREAVIRERFNRGAAAEIDAAQAKQALAEREGRLTSADQRLKQAAIDLSLLFRDGQGRQVMAAASRLPNRLSSFEPASISVETIPEQVNAALTARPEMIRFLHLKERAALEAQVAKNQMQPGLNLGIAAAQDVGFSKPTISENNIFALDRTYAEAFLSMDLPVQRREARGKLLAAQGQLAQLIQQEKFAREQITVEVQTAISVLDRDLQRLQQARKEYESAEKVTQIAREQYDRGLIRLFELNSLEVGALDAQAKVVEILADYYRTLADYRAALGIDSEGVR